MTKRKKKDFYIEEYVSLLRLIKSLIYQNIDSRNLIEAANILNLLSRSFNFQES